MDMGLKKDLKLIADFIDNPYDAKERPEKQLRRLTIGLMIALPIFIGCCHGFGILVAGPLSIYWAIMYLRCREGWKAMNWRTLWLYLMTVASIALGVYFLIFNLVFGALQAFFSLLGFKV